MTKKDRTTTIVGFDLGHGESALAKASTDRRNEPEILQLSGTPGRHFTTAVAVRGTDVRVGDYALMTAKAELHVAFKSPDLERAHVNRPIRLFVQKVVEQVLGESLVPRDTTIRWVFGHPSGWSGETRRKYAELLSEAVGSPVDVVPESRAALLYARECGDIPAQWDISEPVGICDFGSKTTDITLVTDRTGQPIDHGHNELGANLIDKTICELVIDRHHSRDRLREAVDANVMAHRRLEIACRKSKEDYFRTPPEAFDDNPGIKIGGTESIISTDGEDILVDLRLSRAEMEQVLDTPQPALDGATWRHACVNALEHALARIGTTPKMVILTGGPSRMPFILDAARTLIGSKRVMRGSEPEVAIARGLAYAGRLSFVTDGFRAEVKQLIAGGKIESLITERMPELAGQLGRAMADGMTDRHVIPAFVRWRNGEIATLDGMAGAVATSINEELQDPDNPRLLEVMAAWQNELGPDLEKLTRPICDRWGLPAGALTLPPVQVRSGRLTVQVPTEGALDVLNNLGHVVNAVIAGVVSMTLFGAGTALIATTGPVAVVIAFLVALGIGAFGKEAALDKAKSATLPLWLRQLKSEQKMTEKVRADAPGQEQALATAMSHQLVAGSGDELARGVSKGIGKSLGELADEAALLIS